MDSFDIILTHVALSSYAIGYKKMEGWVGKQTMAVTLYAFKLSNLIQLVVIILTSRFLCVFFIVFTCRISI